MAQDPNLTEEEPMAAERPFIRAGWFRGPRGAVVFVYRALVTMDPRVKIGGLPSAKHTKNI
jgi:hypothetical protein